VCEYKLDPPWLYSSLNSKTSSIVCWRRRFISIIILGLGFIYLYPIGQKIFRVATKAIITIIITTTWVGESLSELLYSSLYLINPPLLPGKNMLSTM